MSEADRKASERYGRMDYLTGMPLWNDYSLSLTDEDAKRAYIKGYRDAQTQQQAQTIE